MKCFSTEESVGVTAVPGNPTPRRTATSTSRTRSAGAMSIRSLLVTVPMLLALATSAVASGPAPRSVFDAATIETALRVDHPSSKVGRNHSLVSDFVRVPLDNDVAHYSFLVRVGPGQHDTMRVHRVVREWAPNVPVSAPTAIMMVPGARVGFEGTFLTSLDVPSVSDTQAAPVFLANHGVDVWGVDARWVVLPGGLSDLSPIAGWTFGTDVADLGRALAVARFSRLLTGSGFGRIHLLGFSRGGGVAYAYAGEESQRPRFLRHLEGLVIADFFVKSDEPSLVQQACDDYAAVQAQLDAGVIAQPGDFLNFIGELAAVAPDEPSPIIPVLTNSDVAILFGSDAPETPNVVPFFHRVAGSLDPGPPPSFDLTYTQPDIWFSHFRRGAAFLPLAVNQDLNAALCGAPDTRFDDHLSDIELPLLYVGAGGGIGDFGLFNTTLVSSEDITVHSVVFEAPERRGLDYGHSDLFLADNAEDEVWRAILDWLEVR